MQADIEAHYRWIETVSSRVAIPLDELAAMGNPAGPGDVLHYESPKRRHLTDRVDSVLIHKVWGLVIFGLIMATIFVTIFWLAKPIMDGLQDGIKALGLLVTGHLSDGPIKDLLKDGIFAGVGAVVVFVPQIAILFFFLSVLEDSGYLARAAFLMDRLLAKVGLHGKSFIPLLSSFACAIPGIMATRTIEDRKSRLATILIAPFMSCSARLPVYTLLIGTFFVTAGAFAQAGIMLALYALGIIAAAGTAWIFKRSLLRGPTPAFILELPTYKVPQATQVARQVFNNTWSFLAKAGTTIFCLSILIWAATYYGPTDIRHGFGGAETRVAQLVKSGADDKLVGQIRLEDSFAGRFGHLIEPAIRPVGYDWKMGVGLVGAFAAREVFVSTMGIIYSVGDPGEETADLSKAMRADTHPNGKPVWTPLVAVSLLVWFVLAMQCMSTLAIVRRETGGWGWPIFMLVYMNALAYVVALGVYQIGRIWFV
jgi:ferrous iron transport protein B